MHTSICSHPSSNCSTKASVSTVLVTTVQGSQWPLAYLYRLPLGAHHTTTIEPTGGHLLSPAAPRLPYGGKCTPEVRVCDQ